MAFGGNSLFTNVGASNMDMGSAMGAAGGPYDPGATTGPVPTNPLINRHGSLEQTGRVNIGDYLNTMSLSLIHI